MRFEPTGKLVRNVTLEQRCRHVGGWSNHLHLCMRFDVHVEHQCYCARTWAPQDGQPIDEWRRTPRPELTQTGKRQKK